MGECGVSKTEPDDREEGMYADIEKDGNGFGREEVVEEGKMEARIGAKVFI